MATCCPYNIRKSSGHHSAGQKQFHLAIKTQNADHFVLHTVLNKSHFFFSYINWGLNSSCLCDLVGLQFTWNLAFSSAGTQCSKGAVAAGLPGSSARVCINAALAQNMPERVAGQRYWSILAVFPLHGAWKETEESAVILLPRCNVLQ